MKEILQKLMKGEISSEEAEKMLKTMQIRELEDFAKIDTGRDVRTGVPEAIFAEGKDDDELVKIVLGFADKGHVIVTRLEKDRYALIKDELEVLEDQGLELDYNERAGILVVRDHEIEKKGKIGIITAGTSDRKSVV